VRVKIQGVMDNSLTSVKYGLSDENEFHVVQNKGRSLFRATWIRRGSGSIETDIARQLRTNYLFMSLDDKDIFDLARLFEAVEYNVGDVVIEQGMLSRYIYTVKRLYLKPTTYNVSRNCAIL